MPFYNEDKLKVEVYNKVDSENPGLFEKNPRQYIRLCKRAYEKTKIELLIKEQNKLEKLQSKKRKYKRYTLEEFVRNGLILYAIDYENLNKIEKKERNYKALNFIKQFCKEGKELTKCLYRYYWKIKHEK